MEKKLRLEIDELAVESFAADQELELRGTVEGHAYWSDPKVCPYTENWCCTVNERFCTQAASCAMIETEGPECVLP